MASPLTARPRTRSRSDLSRDSTTRFVSSSAARTACATRNTCGSRSSLACSPNSKMPQNHPLDFLKSLKYNVRAAREEKKTGKQGEPTTEVVDEGVIDKRLLVVEPEFASAL